MNVKAKLQQQQGLAFLLLILLLLIMMIISISNGAVNVPFKIMKESFLQFDQENQLHQVIYSIRLPRVLGAALVGTSLAVTGALAQGITQNPLADSGLLGINAGAALGIAVSFAFLPSAGYWQILLVSFLGAGVSVYLIYKISSRSRQGATPIRLTLAGAGISALFISISQFIALWFNLSQDITFWSLGGVSVISWKQLQFAAPIFLLAIAASLFYSSSVTVLRFGDDTAVSLGKNPQRIRLTVSVLILILSGLSVAIAGSVSFVGLIVPHMMRFFAGENYRKLIPFSAVGGALLVVSADFTARMINPPFETPFGVVVALIGIPFFIYLFRKGGNLG
ncbi:iron ABC transporter permease [Enterococcus sp. BWB1-3]|uniref:FecCD family ABC transporter permease n=1 Tax=Enterococcus sp. BWB1-3 TaxID=2787713 RepID=UPI0019208E85|nr:iron ABC transporter permease [Enterococcus sp. BWB1-3]MBL1230285.1 iron ABC transporter permease [Enterococcus sp. BWB1-3]